MKKIMFTIAIAVGLTGLIFLNSDTEVRANSFAASGSFFGDACKNVKFSAKNLHSKNGQIEIRAVEYFNRANGNWQREDVPNLVVNQGSTFTTGGDDLRDSEGEAITKVKFVYRWKANGREANWSGEVMSKEFVPSNTTCNANRTYGGSSWEIGG